MLPKSPAGYFTLGWLTGNLHKQSFGLIMLVLAVVSAAPGISLVGGLLLLIPAFQMIATRLDRSALLLFDISLFDAAEARIIAHHHSTWESCRWSTSASHTRRTVSIPLILPMRIYAKLNYGDGLLLMINYLDPKRLLCC